MVMLLPSTPSAATASWSCTWVGVRCDCERLRHQLKNPSMADVQGWDMPNVHLFVGNASRLGILSSSLQTLRPCCCACATVRVENRSQKHKRREKLSLCTYLILRSCLRVTTSCLKRQYLPYGPTTSKHGACWVFSCLHIITNTAQLIRMASKARLSFWKFAVHDCEVLGRSHEGSRVFEVIRALEKTISQGAHMRPEHEFIFGTRINTHTSVLRVCEDSLFTGHTLLC